MTPAQSQHSNRDRCQSCGHKRAEHYRDAPMGNGCWHADAAGDCPCSGYEVVDLMRALRDSLAAAKTGERSS